MPGWSPYVYAFDNPLSFTDPDGRVPAPQVRSVSDCPPDCPDAEGSTIYAAAGVAIGVLIADDITGIGVADDVLIPAVALAAVTTNEIRESQRTYVTYTKINPLTGEVYAGRTSGFGTPLEILRNRDRSHHMNAEGFGPARIDRYAQGRVGGSAIRGREQQLIDSFGGALSDPSRRPDAISANRIRGVSRSNFGGPAYHAAANAAFGNLYRYTGLGSRP